MTVHKNKKNNIESELVGGRGQTAQKKDIGSLAGLVSSPRVVRRNRDRRIHTFNRDYAH